MAGISYFVALPFDATDNGIVAGEPVECPSPAAAVARAQGLWKILGHAGAVALSRTGEGFLMSFSLPNFFFHATTAYDILRHKGAPLGKRDFMGKMKLKG
jgi:hypothetical protein